MPETLKPRFFEIFITQIVTVLIILSAIITIKYFFKGTYKEFKVWYKENICAQTDIDEVLK